jgi:hypothetical protein
MGDVEGGIRAVFCEHNGYIFITILAINGIQARTMVSRGIVVGFIVCCEDNSVGMFIELVNSSVERTGSLQRLFIILTIEVLVDSVVEG